MNGHDLDVALVLRKMIRLRRVERCDVIEPLAPEPGAGDQLGGVVGIFLSVPVMAAIKIVFVRARAALQARHDALEKAEQAAEEARAQALAEAAMLQEQGSKATLPAQ